MGMVQYIFTLKESNKFKQNIPRVSYSRGRVRSRDAVSAKTYDL